MKRIAYLMLCATMMIFACKKEKEVQVHSVTVQLTYPASSSFTANAGVTVKLTGKGTAFEAKTNAEGKATFSVPTDIYEISATDARSKAGTAFIYNGVKSNVAIIDGWNAAEIISLSLTESKTSQLVVKEIYTGGVQRDDNSGTFNYDRYIILYNNSSTVANLNNICLATTMPYSSTGGNSKYYGADGNLTYASQGWIPAGQAFWYFQQNVELQPGEQIVIATANAVNNTVTYTKSINFANANYYAMYDIANFTHALTYPTPSDAIPTSHYLKVAKYGAGTAWTLSNASPGLFIFALDGVAPLTFSSDASSNDLYGGAATLISKKVPVSWIVDGVEAFEIGGSGNQKRFTAAVDAGYVYHRTGLGYAMYRNVDKAATEAITTNKDKIVYNYALGTTDITSGSTDPSGIDAEASIKKGARIIYKDTNNSSNDFHLRSKASLRAN